MRPRSATTDAVFSIDEDGFSHAFIAAVTAASIGIVEKLLRTHRIHQEDVSKAIQHLFQIPRTQSRTRMLKFLLHGYSVEHPSGAASAGSQVSFSTPTVLLEPTADEKASVLLLEYTRVLTQDTHAESRSRTHSFLLEGLGFTAKDQEWMRAVAVDASHHPPPPCAPPFRQK